MTAATLTYSAAPRDALAGTGTLVRFMLRRDRVRFPAWVGGIGLMVLYVSVAVPAAYPEEDLADTTSLFADPVGRMFTGPALGLDAPTHERFIASGYALYILLLSALMSLLLVVRHTRGEEETGRAELVRASVVGARAPLTAAMVVAALTNVAVTVVVAVVLIGVGGFGTSGSLLLAAGVGAVGLAFAGVAAVTAQLTQHARAASGLAGAVLGAAFVLRALGDMTEEGGTALSWASPLGWGQQTAPFVFDRWWVLALPLAFAAVTTVAGYELSTRRDFGASLLADRPGPARARPSLGTPVGLAFRLQRGAIIAWTSALTVTGLVFGAFTEALRDAADDLPDTFLDVFGTDDIVAGYLAYIAVFTAFLAAAYAVLAVQGLRSEETSGRAEPVLAAPIGRAGWLGVSLGVTAVAVVVMSVLAGVAAGVGAAIVTGRAGHVGDLALAHLNQVPAVLVVLAVAALCFGVVPRALAVTWAIVGYGVFVGTFGGLLDLPSLARDVSPFEHPAEMPFETFALVPVVVLILLALVPAVVGLAGIKRRDIGS